MATAIHCETAEKLNFACHQSAFAFLRELRIENTDHDRRLDDVFITLSSNPSFLKPKSWRLDRIAPEGSISVKDRDVELEGGFLLTLADAVRGNVTITVEKDGLVLAEETKPVELLAYNEWGGAGYMPELLAAFSMPNDPAVDRVLRARVSSCEKRKNRTASCLDCTMLFASALEQAGLNPIIALPKGHAVVGVWLQPEELTTIVIDEAETLRKRIQLKELVLIETTYVTSHSHRHFPRPSRPRWK